MIRVWKKIAIAAGAAALIAVSGVYGASWYYTTQRGAGCASCHEMAVVVHVAHNSAHRTMGCEACHEAGLATKLRHIWVHLNGSLPETIQLRDVDVLAMTSSCQNCHQHEYAAWHTGPHSATYQQIFADPVHNSRRRLMEDCLRCHGMHFNGSVQSLVQPQNTIGPWHITRTDFADQPTMPCQACHQLHREGEPQTKPEKRISVAGEAVRDSLAIFDRREGMHFSAAKLDMPQLWDGEREVKSSPDPRQALCYQCHAPRQPETGSEAAAHRWGPQVGSGDDRTPMGVHEGISCLACHLGHNENTMASCKNCHPKMSNCGIDVEKMDTTFANESSPHNIHWMKCADCHQHGIPKRNSPPARKSRS